MTYPLFDMFIDLLKSILSVQTQTMIKSVVEILPSPFVALAMTVRQARPSCGGEIGRTEWYCDLMYTSPRLRGDAAALFGNKIELVILALAFAYVVAINVIRSGAPTTDQRHFIGRVLLATAVLTLWRCWHVMAYADAPFQHCINAVSIVVYAMLALATWSDTDGALIKNLQASNWRAAQRPPSPAGEPSSALEECREMLVEMRKLVGSTGSPSRKSPRTK